MGAIVRPVPNAQIAVSEDGTDLGVVRKFDFPDVDVAGGIATVNLGAGAPHTHSGADINSGTVDDARITATLARDTEVTSAVVAHEAAANPHPTYETSAEAQAKVDAHEAAANPHPTYLTAAEGNAAYDAIGAAAAAQAASQPADADIPTVSASQAEMEAGTEAALRSVSPLRVAQAITALGGGTDDQTAAEVPFTPAGTIAATDTQAAVEEVATDAASSLSGHTGDTADAHDASAVSFVPTGGVAASDVQAAIVELDTEKSGTGHTHSTDFGEDGDITTQAFGDAPAAGATGEVADAGHKHGMPTNSGTIVQVKTATSTADDSTTAATMQDSSLSLTFTPLFADSILHVIVDGEGKTVRVTGTILERYSSYDIYNATDAVVLKVAVFGATLVATSAVAAVQLYPIAMRGLYTVDSLTARTFRLRHAAGVVTNLQSTIEGATRVGGITMTIMEVRP